MRVRVACGPGFAVVLAAAGGRKVHGRVGCRLSSLFLLGPFEAV
jgi:hypothetical protein